MWQIKIINMYDLIELSLDCPHRLTICKNKSYLSVSLLCLIFISENLCVHYTHLIVGHTLHLVNIFIRYLVSHFNVDKYI